MDLDILQVLKWVIVTFIAGIIGYMGKYAGRILLERFRKKKEDKDKAAVGTVSDSVSELIDSTKDKAEKKIKKAELKLKKKEQKQKK